MPPVTLTPPRERARRGTGSGLGRAWRVIVLNDDHNTFQGVAFALSNVLPGVTYDKGMTLANRIHAVLPGESGAIAVALVTGIRDTIPPEVNEAMRVSGLYHVISISGLHIAFVSAIVMGLVRYGLALVPSIALRWPVKKIAAAAALAAAFFYMLLAGAPVPAQRSFLMGGLVRLAILLDNKIRPILDQLAVHRKHGSQCRVDLFRGVILRLQSAHRRIDQLLDGWNIDSVGFAKGVGHDAPAAMVRL